MYVTHCQHFCNTFNILVTFGLIFQLRQQLKQQLCPSVCQFVIKLSKQLHISYLALSLVSISLQLSPAILLDYDRPSSISPYLSTSLQLSCQTMIGYPPYLYNLFSLTLVSLQSCLLLVSNKGIATVSHFRLVFLVFDEHQLHVILSCVHVSF